MGDKISEIINKLKTGNYDKSLKSLFKLEEQDKSKVAIAITKLIEEDEDDKVRCKALKLLTELSVPESLPPIIDALEITPFQDYDINNYGNHKNGGNFNDVIIEALIKLRNPESVSMLVDLYEEQKNTEKEDIIIFILKKLDELSIAEFNNIINQDCDRNKKIVITGLLGNMNNKKALDMLIDMYGDPEIRKEIIKAMENFNSLRIAGLLIEALKDRNTVVAHEAARGLKKYISEPEVIKKIINDFKSSVDREREEIVKSLHQIKDENIIPVFIDIIKDNNRGVKIAVLEAIKNMEYNKYRMDLIKCLTEELNNEDIRWEVLITLERFSPPEILNHLIKILKEEDKEIRKLAKNGESTWECRKVIVRILTSIGDKKSVPVIIESLDKNQYFNRMVKEQSWALLIEALSKIVTSEGIPYLIESLKSDPSSLYGTAMSGIIKFGEKSVPKLIEAYHGNNVGKKRILSVLGEINSQDGIEKIKEALSDEDEDIRKHAENILEKISNNG